MKGRIIFLTEEESMGNTLREVLPRFFPDLRENEHWLIISHMGKSDLEASYPRKMRGWREPGVRFVILRDNDGADCRALKERLIAGVPTTSAPYLVRIVCQELESWLLGDIEAVAAAYPAAARQDRFKSLSKQDPDSLTNASQLLKELIGTGAKRERATMIARYFQPGKNTSKSFEVFITGVGRLQSES